MSPWGLWYGVRNEEGHSILEFVVAHELVVANSFFKKTEVQLATFHSGGHSTQIDYLLLCKRHLRACGDCRVRLPGPSTSIIRDVAKESLGVALGTSRGHKSSRESWWISDEVQTKVALKQQRFRELITCQEGTREDRTRAEERYKEAKKEVKKVVACVKDKAYEELYKKLDSKEGANDMYRIVKSKERRRGDIDNIKFIKDEAGIIIMKEDEIRKRWEGSVV
ncbi:uncharacterized protein [Rutidosis leptorrhynchoides]|uniref:uncharacterized protein n=1 Tax=Rutidosis leptorrhynchoides TaxID=125765 RepID=UPI003A9A37B2